MSDQSNSSLEELDGMEGSNEEGEETTISISWIKQIKQISNNWMPLFGIELCCSKALSILAWKPYANFGVKFFIPNDVPFICLPRLLQLLDAKLYMYEFFGWRNRLTSDWVSEYY